MRKKTTRKSQSTTLPLVLVVIGILLVAIVIVWQVAGSLPAQPAPNVPSSAATLTIAEVPRTAVGDAKTAYDANQAVILDVRSQEVYDADHIAGAVSIPLGELETRLGELRPDQWIITYCT